MADTFSGMPIERAWVVHGAAGWDEPTPIGPFIAFDVRPGSGDASDVRTPAEYGLRPARSQDLAGGDAQQNARALRAVFCGEERGAHRDCLLLGTALALEAGRRRRRAATPASQRAARGHRWRLRPAPSWLEALPRQGTRGAP